MSRCFVKFREVERTKQDIRVKLKVLKNQSIKQNNLIDSDSNSPQELIVSTNLTTDLLHLSRVSLILFSLNKKKICISRFSVIRVKQQSDYVGLCDRRNRM